MITGVVQNGVVVFTPGVQLPEGTEVRVEPMVENTVAANEKKPDDSNAGSQRWLLDFIGIGDGLPADMARNHDHYLHGAPKK